MFDDDFPMIMEREAGQPEHVPAIAVAFGKYPLKDEAKSTEAGSPIFKDRVFFKAAVPGDKQSLVFQPATDQHKKRFPRAYEAFEKRETTPLEGTPLEQWPAITRGEALTLRALHIHTVEALAEVHDGNIEKLGFNARDLREKAKGFLAKAKDSAAAQKLAAENKRKDDVIADLQRQIQELAKRMEAKK